MTRSRRICPRGRSQQRERLQSQSGKRISLEDDVEIVLRPHHTFILDNSRVREFLQEGDFVAELANLILCAPFEGDPFDRDDLAVIQAQCAENGAELAAADAFSELLQAISCQRQLACSDQNGGD